MERETVPKLIIRTAEVLAFTLVLFGAFSESSRKNIWRREEARCRDCGKKWRDKYYLECSHNDHSRNDYYDAPSNGKLLCLPCHKRAHERREGRNGLSVDDNRRAIHLIEQRMEAKRKEGFKI